MISRLVPAIALVVVATDAVLLATGTIPPRVALALFLVVEVPLGAVVVTGYVRRYRAHRAATDGRRTALRALAADDPYLRLAAAEARTLASLARWVTRRPDVPAGATPIGYARGTLAIPAAMAVAAGIELVAVHLLVPWPAVRLVLDLLGLYGLVFVLAWLAGRIVRPHLVTDGELVVRSGTHVWARVPLDAVVAVRRERRHSPTSAEIVGGDYGTGGGDGGTGGGDAGGAVLALPGPDGTNLTIELAGTVPATVSGFGWRRPEPQPVSRLHLQVDDPDAAVRAVARVAAEDTNAGSTLA